MTERFSKRYGFGTAAPSVITIRHDAPFELRGVIVDLAYECGFRPTSLRSLVCRTLRKRADPGNWSEYPNVDDEVRDLVDHCDWFRIYDIVEDILAQMHDASSNYDVTKFKSELNEYFIDTGIGWKMGESFVEIRGHEAFEEAVHLVIPRLEEKGLVAARREIHEALKDLSRRPDPDITGGIQHAMAATECVARAVSEDPKATLGEVIKKHAHLIPKPLDEAVTKAWGFASENARHMREGSKVSFEEAELIVGLSATISSYLTTKMPTS